jgi:hypothetical protein
MAMDGTKGDETVTMHVSDQDWTTIVHYWVEAGEYGTQDESIVHAFLASSHTKYSCYLL